MTKTDQIVLACQKQFRTFGGCRSAHGTNNPVAYAMEGGPATFALGVDVRDVVEFVVREHTRLSRKHKRKAQP